MPAQLRPQRPVPSLQASEKRPALPRTLAQNPPGVRIGKDHVLASVCQRDWLRGPRVNRHPRQSFRAASATLENVIDRQPSGPHLHRLPFPAIRKRLDLPLKRKPQPAHAHYQNEDTGDTPGGKVKPKQNAAKCHRILPSRIYDYFGPQSTVL